MQNDVKNILSICGYDNDLSILTLKDDDIQVIEKIMNDDKFSYLRDSKVYQTDNIFQFKPGHKALILSLPEKFEEYLVHKKSNKSSGKKNSIPSLILQKDF